MKAAKTIIVSLLSLVLYSCEEQLATEQPVSQKQETTSGAIISDYNFDGTEGGPIELETARRWISSYKKENPEGNQAHFFGFEILKQLLNEANCVGIRMYYALDDDGKRQLILVGVNAKGENLLPGNAAGRVAEDNIIVDMSYPCPSYCSTTNP